MREGITNTRYEFKKHERLTAGYVGVPELFSASEKDRIEDFKVPLDVVYVCEGPGDTCNFRPLELDTAKFHFRSPAPLEGSDFMIGIGDTRTYHVPIPGTVKRAMKDPNGNYYIATEKVILKIVLDKAGQTIQEVDQVRGHEGYSDSGVARES